MNTGQQKYLSDMVMFSGTGSHWCESCVMCSIQMTGAVFINI